jgi:hypothetical protein
MTNEPDDRRTDIDRQLRAIELKNVVQDISGGQMHVVESEDADPEIAEQFWENVVAFETAPRTTLADRLEANGVTLPPADTLGESQIHSKLWEIADALAGLGVCIENTDHLSDRELYEILCSDLLREEGAFMSDRAGWTYHISPIGSGSEEDMQIHHRYYASEEDRRRWLRDFPEDILPPRETLPYDRDRALMQRFENR